MRTDIRKREVFTDTESRRCYETLFTFFEEARDCHDYEAKLSCYQLRKNDADKQHLEFIKFDQGLTELFECLPQFCWNFLDIPTLGIDTATARYVLSMRCYM